MRSLRRLTATLAALSLVVSTMTGAAMACELGGAARASDAAPASVHDDHAEHESDGSRHQQAGSHGAQHHAVPGGTDAPPPADSQDAHGATCAAMGPCALVLLGAPSSARLDAPRPAAMALAVSERQPPSPTAVPDLPPPKA